MQIVLDRNGKRRTNLKGIESASKATYVCVDTFNVKQPHEVAHYTAVALEQWQWL